MPASPDLVLPNPARILTCRNGEVRDSTEDCAIAGNPLPRSREQQMPSEKLTRILKAKSPFSSEEIAAMSEDAGWDWVYAHAKPKKEKLTQVCFTGFSSADKASLAALAAEARLEVVATVTKSLAFLCASKE